jgi:hypothetical protein
MSVSYSHRQGRDFATRSEVTDRRARRRHPIPDAWPVDLGIVWTDSWIAI